MRIQYTPLSSFISIIKVEKQNIKLKFFFEKYKKII